MTSWIVVAVFGGLVGLDTTSFPQVMISRPFVAGALTGAAFGRPMEGLVIGFVMEAYALFVLPIGASRYPESGTATVAAVAAYLAVAPAGLQPDILALVVAFALAWEWVAGETVVLLRRGNGRLFFDDGVGAGALERRHLAAMSMDFVRGAVVAATGGLIGAGLIQLVLPLWALGTGVTLAILAVLTAGMIGTAVPLFGGLRARSVALGAGLLVGVALALVLP